MEERALAAARRPDVPGRVVLRDYDFERPMLNLTVTAEEGDGKEVPA